MQINVDAIAIRPRQYDKLKDIPLPLIEDRGADGTNARTITVLGSSSDAAWWRDELRAYNQVGVSTKFFEAGGDPWGNADDTVNAVRLSLQLPELDSSPNRSCIISRGQSARGYHWLRMLANRSTNGQEHCIIWDRDEAPPEEVAEVLPDVSPELASRGAVPLCPGPFGGTTVVILPKGIADADRQKWTALETDDPLTKQSRFHRLRIATMDDGPQDLNAVLQKLESENRKNILIVPGEFCASSETMQALSNTVSNFNDRLTIQFVPGLGGELSKIR
jgi:hypothetical protein